MTTAPLEGITVVAVEQAVAAPLASRQLADLGARVIKVERHDGGDFARGYDHTVGGQSSIFVWLNRNKESVQLDLKSDDGQRALHLILERADVLVCNLAPAARERLGLTADELAERHPGLIPCLVSGYRPDGPNGSKKAYDALIQAETGLMSLTGTADSPAKTGISIADIAAGTHALTGVLAALRLRETTGRVQAVEVSLFDALMEWMAYPLYYTQHGGTAPRPMGTAHPTIAPYGAFTAADGHSLMIAVQNEREWQRLCTDVLDDPELAEDPRFRTNALRVGNRPELESVLHERFARCGGEELVRKLEEQQIAWGRLSRLSELAEHPELADDRRWVDTDTPGGTVRTLRPVGLPGGHGRDRTAVPALGAHTDAVLGEFGVHERADTGGRR